MESFVVIGAVCGAFAIGAAGGWIHRGTRAARDRHTLHLQAREAHDRLAEASARVAEVEKELVEMAAAYRELHAYQETLVKQLEAARLHIGGLEDELAVQQRSARVAREELGAARRRVGQLEAELRRGGGLEVPFDEAPTDPGAAAWKA